MPIGNNEEWGRADDACAREGMDAVLLSSLADVTYASGFEVPIPIGAGAEFAYGIPLAVCTVGDRVGDAHGWLIVPNGMAGQAQQQSRLDELVMFDTFGHFEPADSEASYLASIRADAQGGRLGPRASQAGHPGAHAPIRSGALDPGGVSGREIGRGGAGLASRAGG